MWCFHGDFDDFTSLDHRSEYYYINRGLCGTLRLLESSLHIWQYPTSCFGRLQLSCHPLVCLIVFFFISAVRLSVFVLTLGHFVVLQGCFCICFSLFCPALLIIISLLIRAFVDFAEGVCGRGHGRLSPHVLGQETEPKTATNLSSVCLCVTDKVLYDCVCVWTAECGH